jgi:hypothetical protein
VDVLSELLKVVKLDSAIFFNCEFSSPWCYRAPESECAARLLAQNRRHVIIFHLLVKGRAYVHLEGSARVPLAEGDFVTLPHGHAHRLGNGEGAQLIDGVIALPRLLVRGLELIKVGGGGEPSLFVCGFLSCDPLLSKTFLQALPPLFKVNISHDPSGQWLENSLRFAVAEAVAAREGASAMLSRLSEVVFVETVRRHIRALPETETGWLAAARDPAIGRVLHLFHQRPAHRGPCRNWRKRLACPVRCSRRDSGNTSGNRQWRISPTGAFNSARVLSRRRAEALPRLRSRSATKRRHPSTARSSASSTCHQRAIERAREPIAIRRDRIV